MMFRSALGAAMLAVTVAWAPAPRRMQMDMQVDRKGALQRFASFAGAVTLAPAAASAAKYGGFGAGSPEVVNPAEASRDESALQSKDVQDSLSKVKAVHDKIKSARSTLDGDAQADIVATIKGISYADLRIALYKASNDTFDEDSQRGTDRLIRVIMQDINEAELAATQKPGVPRSDRKIEALRRKVQKLDDGITDYLAFFK